MRGLGGKAETAGDQGCPYLDLGERGDQRPAFQSFFQRPGGIVRVAGLDQEKEAGVETEAREAGTVRAPPFARGFCRQAPQHEPGRLAAREARTGGGKGEGKRRRTIAVGGGFEFV